MTLEARRVGAFGKKQRYTIRSDEGSEIADFRSLEKAALAFRYLLGLEMDQSERLEAALCLREYDNRLEKE